MRTQYLSHYARAMEHHIRKKKECDLFQINCLPMSEDDDLSNITTATYKHGTCFDIFYHPKIGPNDLRVNIAHELGHLYLLEIENDLRTKCDVPLEENTENYNSEPLSSLFGIFALMEKDDFYKNRAGNFIFGSIEKIVSHVKLMTNRKKKRYNTSD